MTSGETAAVAACAGAVATLAMPVLATSLARDLGVAHTADDAQPRDASRHLGGIAVVGSVLAITVAIGRADGVLATIALCALAIYAIGTLDDLAGVPQRWQLLAAAIAGIVLYERGARFTVGHTRVLDEPLTIAWTAAITAAFVRLDDRNLASAAAAVAGCAIAVIALLDGHPYAGEFAAVVSGCSCGFLPHSLRGGHGPIALGAGGAMALGVLVAGLALAVIR